MNTSTFGNSLKRVFTQPAFLAAFVVLFAAAMTLNAATQFMKLYFKKEPVQLAASLQTIPKRLGPWIQVSVDQPLNAEMLDVLGTKQFVFRQYVDSRLIPPARLADLENMDVNERGSALARIEAEQRLKDPRSVPMIRASLTYYTGMVDTVAHIPDRCMVADGFIPDVKEFPAWTLRDKDQRDFKTQVTSIHFEDSTPERGAVTRNVVYFFHCNGEYEHDAITGVRMRLQNLFERHAYFAKVEVMTETPYRVESDAAIQDFLQSLMPEVEKCLPDWKSLKAKAPSR